MFHYEENAEVISFEDNHLGAEIPDVAFEPGTPLHEIERAVILETLRQQSYNRTHAARVLGIGIRTLQRKLKKYGASGIGLMRPMAV